MGCESWLTNDILSSEIFPPNYTIFRKDRALQQGGGVFLACRDLLSCVDIDINNNCEAVVCQISLHNNKNLIICSFYRPPNNDIDYAIELCNLFRTITFIYKNSLVWIAGDLNLPNIDWKHYNSLSSSYPLSLCNIFIDFILEFGFVQLVDFPTREQSILDIFFTNFPSYEYTCLPLPGISDHEIVFIKSAIDIKHIKPTARKIYLWHKTDFALIRNIAIEAADNFFSACDVDTPIDILWNSFKRICTTCLEQIPSKTATKRFNQPWTNTKIKRYSRQKECRKAYNNYIASSISTSLPTQSKRLRSYIKSKRKDHCGVGPLKVGSTTYTDSTERANVLNQYFSSIFTVDDNLQPLITNDLEIPDIPPFTVHVEGVAKLLSDIKPHKSSGPDDIPAFLLKEISFQLAPPLTLVFQASLNQQKLPIDWKIAHVVPIFKKGDRASPNNYRPISLTCLCCKILEHIIQSNIYTHLTRHQVFCDEQHGFRAQRSCESQLTLTIDDFATCLNNKDLIHAIFLDFSKAFDKVSHKKLCYKLSLYGIRGPILGWIEDFLSNRTQKVLVNGEKSDPVNVLSGVPQGTVLAPLLFLYYVNDLPSLVKSKIRMYADDTLIYNTIHNINDCLQLQNDLTELEKWSRIWQMDFNPSKCEFLMITNKKLALQFNYCINNQLIKEVQHVKYLGVTIDSRLTWREHINVLSRKANSTLAFLRRNLRPCSSYTKAKSYLCYVRPIIEYSSIIWDPYIKEDIHKLEMVQRRAARFVYNNHHPTDSVTNMLQSLHWLTLEIRRKFLKLILMYKILKSHIHIPTHNFQPVTTHTRGYQYHYLHLQCNCEAYRSSFFPSTIRLWNNLPVEIATSINLNDFITKLESYLLNN